MTELKDAFTQCHLPVEQAMPPQAAAQAVATLAVSRWRQGKVTVVADALAQEVPIAFVYNGISHVVMMATPADLEDFAHGFSFTEGIITARNQIYGIEAKAIVHDDGQLQGVELHIELATEQFVALKAQRRNLTGRTGCGLCGAESLQQVFKHPERVVSVPVRLDDAVIATALAGLPSQQPLQQMTGATHATALVDRVGSVICVREDVGRHNALDKLIGSLLRQQVAWSECWQDYWVLTTSRASYEMVQKVAMAGGRVLVAMSAPTALAVNLAKEYGFLLVGFARAGQCVVYSGELGPAG